MTLFPSFSKRHSVTSISINGITVAKYLVSNIPFKLKKITLTKKYERAIDPKKRVKLLLLLKKAKNKEYANKASKANL